MKLRKGDRVAWVAEGEKRYGVVSKGGGKTVVVVHDGAKFETRGPVGLFKRSRKALPHDIKKTPADAFGVSCYKEHPGLSDETIAFSAILMLNGKGFASVENTGKGADNLYHAGGASPASSVECHEKLKQFHEATKEWAKAFGCPDLISPDDIWISWKTTAAPYGVTAEEYLQKFRKLEEVKPKSSFVSKEQAHSSLYPRPVETSIPKRFIRESVDGLPRILITDTETGRCVSVSLCDMTGATLVLRTLFGEDKLTCPTCHGKKTCDIKATTIESGKPPRDEVVEGVECATCKSKGWISHAEAEARRNRENEWCTCGPNGEPNHENAVPYEFVEDGRRFHGWNCGRCGKLVQTG